MSEKAETVRDYLVRVIGEADADQHLATGYVRVGPDERVTDPARPMRPGEHPVIIPW